VGSAVFREAELFTNALDETSGGGRSFDDAMDAFVSSSPALCRRSSSSIPTTSGAS
jgi:hypothetical protein